MHFGNGFPVTGLSRVDIPYPFTMPVVFYDDFHNTGQADFSATNHAARYKIAGTNAAVAGITRASSPTSSDGVLNIATAGASGDEIYAQVGTNSGFMSFAYSATAPRPIIYQARVSITTTVANCSAAFGLCVGTGITGATTPVDTQCVGAYFVVTAGTLYWCYQTSATTVAITAAIYEDTATAVPTLTVNTFYTLTVKYSGDGTIEFFVNGRRVKKAGVPTFTATTINPFFGVTANTAAAAAINVDYMYSGVDSIFGGRY